MKKTATATAAKLTAVGLAALLALFTMGVLAGCSAAGADDRNVTKAALRRLGKSPTTAMMMPTTAMTTSTTAMTMRTTGEALFPQQPPLPLRPLLPLRETTGTTTPTIAMTTGTTATTAMTTGTTATTIGTMVTTTAPTMTGTTERHRMSADAVLR